MAFQLKKTVDLSEFGWEGCSIELTQATWKEITEWGKEFANPDPKDQKLQEEVFKIVADHFVSGTGLDNGKKVDITKDNLAELPVEIFMKCLISLRGTDIPPNS